MFKVQAVLLAAGKSTRTYPLTVNKPKPLLKVANKTILEHNLKQLEGLIDEAIVVIGFNGNLIKIIYEDRPESEFLCFISGRLFCLFAVYFYCLFQAA